MSPRARANRPHGDDTGRATRTPPLEPPDSLTPLSELTQPIDPEAADRWRYMTTEDAESPRLRIIGRRGVFALSSRSSFAALPVITRWPRRFL
jgi:hypothetical protein